ncbi:MAG: ABC transporter substrate-binding protein [Blautia sp.]
MKKKLIAAILTGAMLVAGMSTGVWAESEKSFVYGTTGYSEEMGDAGLNPHDNYSGWSALRYGVGETLFKYNDNMEVEPWLATDYEFVDDTTVKITLRDGVKFSSGRTMDAEAVKECLEDLIAVHDRAPYDLKIDHIDADGLTLTIYTTEPCPAIINYLGDPYGAIIDMDYGIQGEGGSANIAGTGPYVATNVTPTQIDLVKNEDYWGGDVKVDNSYSKILCRWKCSDRSIADRGYPGNLWIAV